VLSYFFNVTYHFPSIPHKYLHVIIMHFLVINSMFNVSHHFPDIVIVLHSGPIFFNIFPFLIRHYQTLLMFLNVLLKVIRLSNCKPKPQILIY
jgi:hypothetical protein